MIKHSYLYLNPECKTAWTEYEKEKDFNKLNKCIELVDSTYSENTLFDDDCVVLMRKASEFYNKTYDESNVSLLMKKIDDVDIDRDINKDKLCHEIKSDLHKMFNLERKTTTGLCDCVSISLYTMADFGISASIERLTLYLSSIYTSIITLKHNTTFIVRLYIDIGTMQYIFTLVNDESKSFEKEKTIVKNLINSILTSNIVEPYILMCRKRMTDPNYIESKMRLYRYSSFMDDTVRINASREADGCISLLDCHNLNLLAEKNLLMYNSTNTKNIFYWNARHNDECWVDLYDNYSSKYYDASITMDIKSFLQDFILKDKHEEKSLLDIINENKNFIKNDKYDYNGIKNIICPIWAGMISFGFQLKKERMNKITIKINNLIDKLAEDIKLLNDFDKSAQKKELLDSLITSVKKLEIKALDVDYLLDNRITEKDILPYLKKMNTENLDECVIPPKLNKYLTAQYEDFYSKLVKTFLAENEGGDHFQKMYDFRKKNLNKINIYAKTQTIEYAKLIINTIRGQPRLGQLLYGLCNLQDSFDYAYKLANDIYAVDLDKLRIGFDEILLYKYFQKIIVFNQNPRQIQKLSILNSLSFNFTYMTALSQIKTELPNLIDLFNYRYKKLAKNMNVNYDIVPMIDSNIKNIEEYIDMINQQKKILEEQNDLMIKYNSQIDIIPFFNNVLLDSYFTFDSKFREIYKLLTNTDFVDIPTETNELVYNIRGGAFTNEYTKNKYYSKYLKYKKKYLTISTK